MPPLAELLGGRPRWQIVLTNRTIGEVELEPARQERLRPGDDVPPGLLVANRLDDRIRGVRIHGGGSGRESAEDFATAIVATCGIGGMNEQTRFPDALPAVSPATDAVKTVPGTVLGARFLVRGGSRFTRRPEGLLSPAPTARP